MNTVRLIPIMSPSGQLCTPKTREYVQNNHIVVEAYWTDPSSGAFLQKGIVKVLDKNTREDITNTL